MMNDKRKRTLFTPMQLTRMEEEFRQNMYVVGLKRWRLATELCLTEKQIKIWFQNRRMKLKREQVKSRCLKTGFPWYWRAKVSRKVGKKHMRINTWNLKVFSAQLRAREMHTIDITLRQSCWEIVWWNSLSSRKSLLSSQVKSSYQAFHLSLGQVTNRLHLTASQVRTHGAI